MNRVKFPRRAILRANVLENCTGLESVSIPKNMTRIPDKFCANSRNLKSVQFNSDIVIFGRGCFDGCSNLAVELPKSIQKIESRAMRGTANHELIIPETCEHIGEYAFADMQNLEHITFVSDEFINIDTTAFCGCKNLKTVRIGGHTYPVSYRGDRPMFTIETRQIHGINIAKVRHIGFVSRNYYHAWTGDIFITRQCRELAIDAVRKRVIATQQPHVQSGIQKLKAENSLKLDFSVQELYCISNSTPERPIISLSMTPEMERQMALVHPFNCAECKKIHPAVYKKCMERCGLEK